MVMISGKKTGLNETVPHLEDVSLLSAPPAENMKTQVLAQVSAGQGEELSSRTGMLGQFWGQRITFFLF